jgi:hypothetical protein
MSRMLSFPLHVQKAVVGRLLVYRALDLYHAEVEAAGYGLLWGEVRARMQASTARQLEFRRSAQSLWEYLGQLAAELRSALLPFPDADAEAVCTPLLDEIDRILARAGELRRDLLRDAFERAMQIAAAEYGRHGLRVPPAMLERVSVSFDHQATPLTHALPIHLSATTHLRDPPGGPTALVEVVVTPTLVDEPTAFALPYVLLHECLCHVLQGPWEQGRLQADADSRFAEGWMDVAAYLLHQGLPAAAAGVEAIDLMATPRPLAQREAAHDAHTARHAPGRDDRARTDRAWAHRALGKQAANGMLTVLAALPETRSDPTTPFMRLSLALNAASVDNHQRDYFATAVYKSTSRESSRHRLVALVRDYLECGDVQRLVGRVLKLVS